MSKRNFARVALVAALLASVASVGYAQPYTAVHVFGNSHADVGNISFVTMGAVPPSPPYFQGRFSNGPAFPEVAADNLNLGPLAPSMTGGTDYAWGGALSLGAFPSVRSQVLGFLGGGADPGALCILEGGGILPADQGPLQPTAAHIA